MSFDMRSSVYTGLMAYIQEGETFLILELTNSSIHYIARSTQEADSTDLENDEIPTEYHQQVIHTLSILSELQEISFHTHSLLPHSMHLSRISYLEITRIGTEDTDLSDCLIQLIHRNQHTIRGLKLDSFFIIF